MQLQIIPLDKLRPCSIQMRPVRKETLEYLELKGSIKNSGILTSLLVRPYGDYYEVVLGNYRYEIGKDLHLSDAPCIIRDMTDDEVRKIQMEESSQRINTTPVEEARRLWKIIESEPALTLPELAYSLNKNVDYTRRMLKLDQLCQEAQELLVSNRIPLSLALELSKLPHCDQQELLRMIDGVSTREAIELARQKARHFRQLSKNTRVSRRLQDSYSVEPAFRNKKDLIHEMNFPTDMASVLQACNARTNGEVWKAALMYVFQIDPETKRKRLQKQDRRNK